jgi:hypothetical protein
VITSFEVGQIANLSHKNQRDRATDNPQTDFAAWAWSARPHASIVAPVVQTSSINKMRAPVTRAVAANAS